MSQLTPNAQLGLRPASATHFASCVLSLLAGLAVIWIMARTDYVSPQALTGYAPLLPCAAIVVVLAAAQLISSLRGRRPLPEVLRAPIRELDLPRVGLRLLGFVGTLALVAIAYWLFPEYSGSFYAPYWRLLLTLAPFTVLVPFYFLWIDRRTEHADDEFVQFGKVMAGQWRGTDPGVINRHLLGWVVKAFFLPLMAVYLSDQLRNVVNLVNALNWQAFERFDLWFQVSFLIDLLFCVVGYATASRLFDSHIRSVEPTMLGWTAALLCYQPFYSVIGRFYLQYEGNVFWDNWLEPWPLLRNGFATAIIVLSLIYALSTVAFGLRFSNLTHRGIITSGPYRFTKHPAYVSKNLSWWLISVPFAASQGWLVSLRHCALLLLLNGVYLLRARTEERHLSRDPVYVAYAEWIDRHGLFRGVGRLLPWLRYRAPSSDQRLAAGRNLIGS